MLRVIAQMVGHRLALPRIALTEHLDAFERQYRKALTQVEGLGSSLRADSPERVALLNMIPRFEDATSWGLALTGPHAVPSPDSAREMRNERVLLHFEVVEEPEGHEAEALKRESARVRPALESGGSGRGARDVSIWLAALAAAKSYPGNVYFVSADRGFRDGVSLHVDLRLEAKREGCGNLVFCTDVEELIDRLSCPIDGVNSLADSLSSSAEERSLADLVTDRRGPSAASTTSYELDDELNGQLLSQASRPGISQHQDEVSFERLDDLLTRRIGKTTLAVATVYWGARRSYEASSNGESTEVHFGLRTSMLIRRHDGAPEVVQCCYRWPARLKLEV